MLNSEQLALICMMQFVQFRRCRRQIYVCIKFWVYVRDSISHKLSVCVRRKEQKIVIDDVCCKLQLVTALACLCLHVPTNAGPLLVFFVR